MINNTINISELDDNGYFYYNKIGYRSYDLFIDEEVDIKRKEYERIHKHYPAWRLEYFTKEEILERIKLKLNF